MNLITGLFNHLPNFCHPERPYIGKELPLVVAGKTRRETDSEPLVLLRCARLDCIVYTMEVQFANAPRKAGTDR